MTIEIINRCPVSQTPHYTVWAWCEPMIHAGTGEVLRDGHWAWDGDGFENLERAERWAAGGVNAIGDGPEHLITVLTQYEARNIGRTLDAETLDAWRNCSVPTFASMAAE